MGQEEQFMEAYDANADSLFRHAYFRVSDRDVALDLVQDSYTKTWDYLSKGNQVDDFRPFLYRTLNNLIIDHYRKKKSDSLDAILDEEVGEGKFDELHADSKEEIEIAFDAELLRAVLDTLPAQYREVVVFRYIDGFMPQEIADMMKESVNVISVRIHRGIAMLKKKVEEQEQQS